MVSRFRHRRRQYCPGPAERALQPCTHDDAPERMHLLLPYVSGFPLPSWPELLTGLT